ncbi:MAG TPA: hypothetical protein VEZ14_12150 [Dehalococcoidia bacterium]|nr:hypothetical protein [Dehalococcoidia bacterium]
MITEAYPDLEFRVTVGAELSAADRAAISALFDVCYRQANHAYLEKSFGTLRWAALAWHEGALAGFSLAESRVIDLPRLPATAVHLAGICCIAPAFRRRHLFATLERKAGLTAAGGTLAPEGRRLGCGRMAHPASFRGMTRIPSVVPRPGVTPTAWQQEVGAAIAREYGVRDFDPRTFVCHGSGTPIGYPVLEMDVEPREWEVFREVDRDRGDALLGIAWLPDPPAGWDA